MFEATAGHRNLMDMEGTNVCSKDWTNNQSIIIIWLFNLGKHHSNLHTLLSCNNVNEQYIYQILEHNPHKF